MLSLRIVLRELHLVVGDTRFAVSTHGLAIAIGFAVGALLVARRARVPGPALVAAAAVAVGALGGARLLFCLLHGPGAGFASMGGVAGALVVAWGVARAGGRHPAEVLDPIAPAALLGLAIGRVGCFLAGCCFGRPTALAWGVVFPELGPPARHPLQLYSAVGDLALVVWLLRTAGPPGAVARRACVGFGLLRAMLEILRDPGATDSLPGGWLTLPQAAALVLAAGAVVAGNPCVAGGLRLCLGRSLRHPTEDASTWPRRSR